MKQLFARSRIAALAPPLALLVASSAAQSVPALDSIKSQEELEKTIATLDAALFDAFNRCDPEKFSTFFVDDVEFYNDQGGVTLGREKLVDSGRAEAGSGDFGLGKCGIPCQDIGGH